MTGISFPEINASLLPASPTFASEHKTLIMGLAGTGTYTAGLLYFDADNNEDLQKMVGVDSPLGKALRIHAGFNKNGKVSIVPLAENGAGTAASGSIVVANTATASGTVKFLVGGSEDIYSITIALGDTASVVAGKIRTAINANPYSLVSAAGTGATVALTAKLKGLHGNFVNILSYNTPINVTGCTFTITAMSGGAGDPTHPTLASIAPDQRFNTVIVLTPDSTIIQTLMTEMNARFNVEKKIVDGILVASLPLTTVTAATLTSTHQTNRASAILAVKEVNRANFTGLASKRYCFEDAVIFGSFRQLKFTAGSFLTNYVQNGGTLDIRGGIHQSAKPYPNTILNGWELPEVGTDFSADERASLKGSGVFCIGVHKSGQYLTFAEAVTPYRKSASGAADNSYTFVEYVDSLVHCRNYINEVLASVYAQSALAASATVVGFQVATEASIVGEMIDLFAKLASDDFLLLDQGADTVFTSNLKVTVDKRQGLVTIACVLPILTQLRRIDLAMTLTFDVN